MLSEEQRVEAVGEPVAVTAACPAAHAAEQLVEFGAGERPDGFDGFVEREPERAVGGEGIDEAARLLSRKA